MFLGIGLISGTWVVADFIEDLYVDKVPTAILAVGTTILGFGSIGLGVLLNTLSNRFRETTRVVQQLMRGSHLAAKEAKSARDRQF